jgi:excinuclease ABC subunit B
MKELEQQMREAAKKFDFERAAQVRDRLKALKNREVYETNALSGAGVRGPN